MERSFLYKELAPLVGMIAGECATAASNTVYKTISSDHEISFYVFTFYTCLAAALVLLPFAIIFRRSGVFSSDKLSFFLRLISLSAMGVGCQLFSYKGLEYSSPTLASAISNLVPAFTFILAKVPAFTFILAVFFGIEKIDLKSSSSIAKNAGLAVSIAGALVVVFYKGPVILSNPFSGPTKLNLPPHPSASSQPNWIMGGFCFFAQYLLNSFWDVWVIPSSLQSTHGGVHVKGPVYVSSFRPLSIVIAATTGFRPLYLGSIIGATIIASEFYSIMWGKIKE